MQAPDLRTQLGWDWSGGAEGGSAGPGAWAHVSEFSTYLGVRWCIPAHLVYYWVCFEYFEKKQMCFPNSLKVYPF